MTLPRNVAGFGLSSIAQSFCRAVFNQVPSSGLTETPVAQREAFASLTPDEREALALEKLAIEEEKGAVLKGYSAETSASLFVAPPAFPVLAKFQTLIESIEEQARRRVLAGYTEEERWQLELEEAEYARDFAKFEKQAQVLNSRPGQWKIYLPCPPQKGPVYERFEREMRRTLEKAV